MRSLSLPTPPARPPAPPHEGHAQRAFLLVNAVPLGIGVVLSCSSSLTGVTVHGRLTLGVVWGLLHLGSAWWYENRATSLCDPGARSRGSQPPLTGPESGW